MRRLLIASPLVLALAACGLSGTDRDTEDKQGNTAASSAAQAAASDNALLSHDPTGNTPEQIQCSGPKHWTALEETKP